MKHIIMGIRIMEKLAELPNMSMNAPSANPSMMAYRNSKQLERNAANMTQQQATAPKPPAGGAPAPKPAPMQGSAPAPVAQPKAPASVIAPV